MQTQRIYANMIESYMNKPLKGLTASIFKCEMLNIQMQKEHTDFKLTFAELQISEDEI